MVAYSFQKRFVVPIKLGLGMAYALDDIVDIRIEQPKRQTIRAYGKRRHARADEELQLYTAMRTKQCELIGRARCVYTTSITIQVLKNKLKFSDFVFDADAFARSDGFVEAADMHAFWLKEHGLGKFEGVLIRWEPLT
jgi:hypothetical protein